MTIGPNGYDEGIFWQPTKTWSKLRAGLAQSGNLVYSAFRPPSRYTRASKLLHPLILSDKNLIN